MFISCFTAHSCMPKSEKWYRTAHCQSLWSYSPSWAPTFSLTFSVRTDPVLASKQTTFDALNNSAPAVKTVVFVLILLFQDKS